MRKFFMLAGAIMFALILLHDTGERKPLSEVGERLSVVMKNAEANLAIAERSQASACIASGSLPDPRCTPGAVFSEASLDDICVSGYTKKVRNVSASLKKKVFAEYGLPYPPARGTYEADHLVPLELGGSNDIANLFPEAASPAPGFKEKDLVEDFLHEEACAGRISLSAAQKQIAHDWTAVYAALSDDQIKALKDKYRSWAE